jgi:hypothetical protein
MSARQSAPMLGPEVLRRIHSKNVLRLTGESLHTCELRAATTAQFHTCQIERLDRVAKQ